LLEGLGGGVPKSKPLTIKEKQVSNELQKLSAATKALAEAKSLDEITHIRDIAKSASVYAQAAKLGLAMQNDAIEVQLLAERKAGELLAEMPKNPGSQGQLQGRSLSGDAIAEPPETNIPTLDDLGITTKESARWQKMADIPEPQFRASLETVKEKGEKLTATGLLRNAGLFDRKVKTTGPLLENEGVEFGFWALPRPLTTGWGSGGVWPRMISEGIGTPDAAFGVRDQVPADVIGIDHSTGYEWTSLPFEDNTFVFGYWDPPYDKLYKQEGQEIWRVCRKIAILHTHIWPRSWLDNALRCGMYAITMGPMKQIRCLQVFEKANVN